MKTIAIFCRTLTLGEDPFSSDYYWQAYQDLLLALKERGVQAYFATDNNSYLDYGLFDTVYAMDGKTSLENLIKVRNVKVDLVFDRGGFIGRNVPTINSDYVQKVGMNKVEMHKHFAQYQPFSIVCNGKQEVADAFRQIDGEKIVVKEPEGAGGKQVYIGEKEVIFGQLPEAYPVLVQEFLDTSAGVPGQVEGVHDIRLSVCGGNFIGYYVRKAQEGSLHSNVSRGGTMVFFDVDQIPTEPAEVARTIDEHFAAYPRYYAIDFILTPKGWKLLELNPYLALLPLTDGPEAQATCSKLADYLVDVCNQSAS